MNFAASSSWAIAPALKATALFWDSNALILKSHAPSPKSSLLGRTPLSFPASISIFRISASGLDEEPQTPSAEDSAAAGVAEEISAVPVPGPARNLEATDEVEAIPKAAALKMQTLKTAGAGGIFAKSAENFAAGVSGIFARIAVADSAEKILTATMKTMAEILKKSNV